jgi:hypothetical protein
MAERIEQVYIKQSGVGTDKVRRTAIVENREDSNGV